MLYFEAASWADIVELAHPSSSYTDSITIKLTSDIDCNREIPEGVDATLSFITSSTGCTVTIDGGYDPTDITKRRVIRNLQTHVVSPVDIFSTNHNSFILRNIDFINLKNEKFLAKGGSNGPTLISNCRFVGKRKYNLFKGSNGGIKMSSCFFNIPYQKETPVLTELPIATVPSSLTASNHQAYWCHFRETYGGWTPDNSKFCTSFGNLNVDGCYVDGEIVADSVIILTNQYSYASKIQSVIDADLKTISAEGTTISVQAPNGVWRNDIHSTDSSITGIYQYTNVNNSAIPETPANMKNTTTLYNDGFDVVH